MMKYKEVRIMFLPDNTLAESAIKIANELIRGEDPLFVISEEKNFPHITIYNAEFPNQDIPKIERILTELSRKMRIFSINPSKYENGWGYIGIGFEHSEGLVDNHKVILESLNPLRKGHLREKYSSPAELSKYSVEERINIKKYGYPYVLNCYNPHLNLARLRDEKVAKKIINRPLPPEIDKLFCIESLALGFSGAHGTVTKILKKFPLVK